MDQTPEEPSAWEYPDEGPWKAIERGTDSVTYYPRNPSKQPRYERSLPSGRVLIDDLHAGFVIRTDYRADFDWSTFKGKGRSLGDQAIMKRQSQGKSWFVLSSQERYDDSDMLVSSTLSCVEEYCGNKRLRIKELTNNA